MRIDAEYDHRQRGRERTTENAQPQYHAIAKTVGQTARREAREAGDGAPDPAVMEEVEKKMNTLRETMSELRPRMPEGAELADLTEKVEEMAASWRSTRAKLRDEFFANLRAILNEQQMELWPIFRRSLRRVKSLRGFSGAVPMKRA